MNSTTAPKTLTAASTAFKASVRLGGTASRAAAKGVTPARRKRARELFEAALRDLVWQEDRHGIDYVAWISDLLTRDRQYAMEVGVLTAEDVSRIEREVCASI